MSRTRSTLILILATLAAATATAAPARAETNRAQFSGGYCTGSVQIVRTGNGAWSNATATCMGNTPRQILFIVNGRVVGNGPWTGSWSGFAYYVFTGTYDHSWDYWGGKITACAALQTRNGANIAGNCTTMTKGLVS